jgi:hypothetical protein
MQKVSRAPKGTTAAIKNGSPERPYIRHIVKHEMADRAMTLAGVVENNTITIGIAVSRPGDIFDRKKGTLIASNRANRKPYDTYNIPEEFQAKPGYYFGMLANDLATAKAEEIEERVAAKKHGK